jgi:hypothetical protein
MSERKWRPGDLITGDDGSRFWIVEVTANTTAAATNGRAWVPGSSAVDADGNGWRADSVEGARPLVVIDPEDREQVERFREIASRWADQVPYSDMREPGDMDHTDAMQAALREFADPKPRIEEPTGLGAVVVEAGARRFTRWAPVGHPRPWALETADDRLVVAHAWDDLAVSEILSPGVTS